MARTADEIITEPDDEGLDLAVEALRRGELVAFPTETVYGLGADARSDEAVAAIYAAKGRPSFNPLIVHVADLAAAERIGVFSRQALRLAERFWPGPLTLVLPLRSSAKLSRHVTAGLDTIALRVPAHEVAQALLTAFDSPLAAPSANPSGRLSPTEPEHVEDMLGDKLALILDGGPCEKGLESTILKVDEGSVTLLRPGALDTGRIETLLADTLQRPDGPPVSEKRPASAPGMLSSHYAPRARLRLDAEAAQAGEMMLAFGPDAPTRIPGLNLSPSGDLAEAASNLYAYLHMLDDTGVDCIAVSPIPMQGLGVAINDRLRRAAAPRDG